MIGMKMSPYRGWSLGTLLAAAAAFLCGPSLPAQTHGGDATMLVSTGWLQGRLDDPSLVILHVGSRADYDAGHIPGARLLSLADISISSDTGLRLELPPVPALEDAFARLGVSPAARIVVYTGANSVQSATRVWFTLDYLGWGGRAALLDGGLAAWRAEKRALSTAAPAPAPAPTARLTAHPADRVVTAEWVRARLNDPRVRLLDARTPQFFSGADAGVMPRAGHIPGARSVPYPSLLDDRGAFKPAAEMRQILLGPGGADATLTVTYCHIGQQATVLYFVARYLGMNVRLYDGSFQDWSRRPDFPVETSLP